jgi:hypothetical protein
MKAIVAKASAKVTRHKDENGAYSAPYSILIHIGGSYVNYGDSTQQSPQHNR